MTYFKSWLSDTAERAVRTAAQTAVSLLGVNAVTALDADWGQVAAASSMAALLSVLMSIAGSQVGDKDTGSLLP